MQSFLISKHFESDLLVVLMVVALEYLAKTALANLFLDFVSVCYVVLSIGNILILFIVKTVVILTRVGVVLNREFPFLRYVQVENGLELKDLLFFIIAEELGKLDQCVLSTHRELLSRLRFLLLNL